MSEFRMPQLGADMAAGTLVEWLKKPGEPVKRGDIVAVVETDKGAIEVEIFETGVLERIVVQPGMKVPVGAVLAVVRGEGAAVAAPIPAAENVKPSGPSAVDVPPPRAPLAPEPRRSTATDRGELRISPAAARMAAAHSLSLAGVRGTGTGGAIRMADVQALVAGQSAEALPSAAGPASPGEAVRRAIAAAMSRSNRDIPHYYLLTTIDFSRATEWLTRRNEQRPVTARMLYGAVLMKAVALALRDFPELNGFWRDGRFEAGTGIHLGSAISLRGGGLVAPAVHDCDRLDLEALMAALRDLVKRARAMRLRSSELSDATLTVTSLGEQGVDTVFGVIYPPQVALVGFGTPVDRPWADGKHLRVRRVVQATLAGDHRASDGHRGALFLSRIDKLLQEPDRL